MKTAGGELEAEQSKSKELSANGSPGLETDRGFHFFVTTLTRCKLLVKEHMNTLLIAIHAGLGFIIAYHAYGRWLDSRIFNLAASQIAPRSGSRTTRSSQEFQQKDGKKALAAE